MTAKRGYLSIIFRYLQFLGILPLTSRYAILNSMSPIYLAFYLTCWVHVTFGLILHLIFEVGIDIIEYSQSISLVLALINQLLKTIPFITQRNHIYKLQKVMDQYIEKQMHYVNSKPVIESRINQMNLITK